MNIKKYVYGFSAFALAFAIGGAPAAFANTQDTATGDGANIVAPVRNSNTTNTQKQSFSNTLRQDRERGSSLREGSRTSESKSGEKMTERTKEQFNKRSENKREFRGESRNDISSSSSKTFLNERAREQFKQKNEKAREQLRERANKAREFRGESRNDISSSSSKTFLNERAREQFKQKNEKAREQFKQRAENIREAFKNRIEFMHESTTTPVYTLAQLKRMIVARRAQIKSEVASTTAKYRKIVAQATPVRVAVQALLASKNLLGTGVGQKVSEIAKQVNNSVASTTNVEAQIQSRGFFTRLFFGGDTRAADEIKRQVIQNQDRIKALSGLLSKSSTTQEIKAELGDQVQTMQEEQSRLQEVAQRQSSLWGIFSWRF